MARETRALPGRWQRGLGAAKAVRGQSVGTVSHRPLPRLPDEVGMARETRARLVGRVPSRGARRRGRRVGGPGLRVNMILKRLTGERPSTVLAWHRVAEGNCVAERRGGEQPKANLSSQSSQTRQLNPIRPFGMASLRRKGEALALSLPEAITKHDHTIAKDSDGVWDEKAGKAEQLSVEILLDAAESGEEVRALIVALKRVTTVEPRGVGR